MFYIIIFTAKDANCGILFIVGDFLLVDRPRVGEVMEKLKAKVEDMTVGCSKYSDNHFS